MKTHIVVIGNPVDGYSFYGPFEDSEDACEFAEANLDEWWLADLMNPEGCVK